MKRFALIIEASDVDSSKLPGAKVDAQTYHDWMYSKSGGDWFSSEMVTLHSPTVAEVKRAISTVGKTDYAFVSFSGHGFHSKELDKTKICLKGGTMTAREIVPDTDRCTVVIDACRNVMPDKLLESVMLAYGYSEKRAELAQRDYRKDFEVQVAAAEKGTIFLYSCDLDEAAGEDRNGGYFSRYLVKAGRTFADRNGDGSKWYSMARAFEQASVATTEHNKQQHPKYEPGRRLIHFPWGV